MTFGGFLAFRFPNSAMLGVKALHMIRPSATSQQLSFRSAPTLRLLNIHKACSHKYTNASCNVLTASIFSKLKNESKKVWTALAGKLYSKKLLEDVLKYRNKFRSKK